MRKCIEHSYLLLIPTVVLFVAPAFADGLNSGWDWTLTCPTYDDAGNSGTFSSSLSSLFSGSGTCTRIVATRFQKIDFTSSSGSAALRSSIIYPLNTGTFFISPPVTVNDIAPVFSVATTCPGLTQDVNWIFVQWDPSFSATLQASYFEGYSTMAANSTTLHENYDIDGNLTWSGNYSLPIAGCASGVYTVNGGVDFNAKIYPSADWSGDYKTGPGRASFFLPVWTINTSYLASLTFNGLLFNSADASSVKNVQVTSDAGGTTFTVKPYLDPEAGTIDSAFTDTITIAAANSPRAGMMKGTVARGASTGKIVCIADLGGNNGIMVTCSGQDPVTNANPYSVTFTYKPPASNQDTLYGGSQASGASFNRVAIDGSGRTVAAGANCCSVAQVSRFLADGSMDTTFNSGGATPGYLQLPFPGDSGAKAVAIQSDGKIVVGGYSTVGGIHVFAVARLNADGSLDTNFNPSGSPAGTVYTTIGSVGAQILDLRLQSDGMIVAVGRGDTSVGKCCGNAASWAIARYTSSGALDTTGFNSGGSQPGVINPLISNANDIAKAVAIRPTGEILVAGPSQGSGTRLAQYLSTGTLDTNFGSSGLVNPPIAADDVEAMALLDDGKVLLAGSHSTNFILLKFNTDGSADTADFNPSGTGSVAGTVITDFGTDYDNIFDLGIQSDGKILTVGWTWNPPTNDRDILSMARYYSDGSLDTTFGSSGTITFPSTFIWFDDTGSVALKPDGSLIVGWGDGGGMHRFWP